MTFDDFVKGTTAYYAENRDEMRFGQAFFNYLYQVRPDIADFLRGTSIDPFHKKYVTIDVWRFVHSQW